MNINENEIIDRVAGNESVNNNNNANKTEKNNTNAKKEPIIIPKFLMKFSSTYFKRASDNALPQLNANKQDKIKDKIIEKTDQNTKDHHSLRRHFQKKHGRSSSEIDYDKLLRAGKISNTGSSIYEMLNNRLTEHTQNTQPNNPTIENYAITIPTEVGEEDNSKAKKLPRISHSPLEVINFFSTENSNPNDKLPNTKSNNFLQMLNEEEVRRNKSIAPNMLSPLTDKEKDPISHQELGMTHTRSRSLQFAPMPKDESFQKMPQDTLQVVYTPSNQEVVRMNEEKKLDNLDRSVVNCLICFDKVPDAVFMECGHGGNY